MPEHRISIDPSACTGFGACVDLDPETFVLGGDGIAVATVAVTDREAALAAARACPMTAITVMAADGARGM